jgi:tetratricopeptide (TPR) repeat protein
MHRQMRQSGSSTTLVPYDEAEEDRASYKNKKFFLHHSDTSCDSQSVMNHSLTITPFMGKPRRRRMTSSTEEPRHTSWDGEVGSIDGDENDASSLPPKGCQRTSSIVRDSDKGYHTDSCIVIATTSCHHHHQQQRNTTSTKLSPFLDIPKVNHQEEPVVEDTSESSEETYEEDALEELLVKGTGLEQIEGTGAALSLYDRAVKQGLLKEALNVAFLEYKMGILLWKNGSYEKSLNVLKRSLNVFERHGGTRTRTMAEIYFAMGRGLSSLSRRTKAHKYFMKALRTLDYDQFLENHVHPEDQQLYAKILTQVASLLVDQGNYSVASNVLADAITLQRQVLGPNHIDIAGTLLVYGSLNEALQQNEYAANCFLQALEMFRNNDTDAMFSSVDVSVTLSNVGWLFYKTGDYTSALHSYEEALEIVIPILGANHRNVNSLQVQMGMCYAQQGNLNKALKIYRQALEGQRVVLGDNHEDVALTLSLVGRIYHVKENYGKALEFIRHALTIRQQLTSNSTPSSATVVVGTLYVQLGQVYTKLQEVTHAVHCFSHALTIYHTNHLPVTDVRVVEARQALTALELRSSPPSLPEITETSTRSSIRSTTTEQRS